MRSTAGPTAAGRRGPALALCLVLLGAPSWAGAAGAGAGAGEGATRRTGDPPPNVLVIVTDDQRADTLHAMPRTSRWLVGAGTVFPNAFATTPLCCPSRASIFTGRYAHNHGVTSNRRARHLDQRSTLQRRLQAHGYLTAIAGKYFNGWNLRRDPPHFDRWAILNSGYRSRPFNLDGTRRRVAQYGTRFLGGWSARVLRDFERRDRTPWFLYVAPIAPHGPLDPSEGHPEVKVPPWKPGPAARETDRSDKPRRLRAPRAAMSEVRRTRRLQLRTLEGVDRMVGRLMRTLRRQGELEDTLILFLSDNGYLWGEHRLDGKRNPYLASVRIPLAVRWPEGTERPPRDERLAANIDIAPTVLDAAGVSRGRPMDGRSLLGAHRRDHLLMEYVLGRRNGVPGWAAVLTADAHFIETYDRRGKLRYREYYDLRRDPHELRNLLPPPFLPPPEGVRRPIPSEVGRMLPLLQGLLECSGTSGPGACP